MSFKLPVREVAGVPRESQVVPRGLRGPRESHKVPGSLGVFEVLRFLFWFLLGGLQVFGVVGVVFLSF